MSKTQLKKELQQLDKEQLIQLTLDAYSAKREIKDYFDFFLDPDVDRLHDKRLQAATKEIGRVRHGYMRMRVTVVKRLIKDFASYDPGVEWELKLMVAIFKDALMKACIYRHQDTIDKFIKSLLTDILVKSDRAAMLDQHLPGLIAFIKDRFGASSLRRELMEIIDNAAEVIATS